MKNLLIPAILAALCHPAFADMTVEYYSAGKGNGNLTNYTAYAARIQKNGAIKWMVKLRVVTFELKQGDVFLTYEAAKKLAESGEALLKLKETTNSDADVIEKQLDISPDLTVKAMISLKNNRAEYYFSKPGVSTENVEISKDNFEALIKSLEDAISFIDKHQ